MVSWIPNFLTLLRMGSAPVILWCYNQGKIEAAIYVTIAASLTDFLDGWAARALGSESRAGAILDPVADKILILSLFAMLYIHGAIPVWLYGVSTTRNISQLLAIPVLLWWRCISFQVKPRLIPKWGSALSYVVIMLGLAVMTESGRAQQATLERLLLGVSAVLSVLEIQILATYWPRFIAIYRGKHDTFE